MWILGDWGQASPWSRASGVSMTKGEDDVWTGELSLPKGTKFDIKILKSTVSTTTGGNNVWSAIRYSSVLNTLASHDFGEFTDNLIPNGNFDEGKVKWTPAELIVTGRSDRPAQSAPDLLIVGGNTGSSCTSDVFTLPPNQTLRLTGYAYIWHPPITGNVTMKVVTPQQQTLFEFSYHPTAKNAWEQFSKTFKTGDVPVECQLTLSNDNAGAWYFGIGFDTLSLVSP